MGSIVVDLMALTNERTQGAAGIMNDLNSRYHFRTIPDGFVIEGQDRSPVEVRFRRVALEARQAGGRREWFGLFNFGKLLEFVAEGLMADWQARSDGWFGAKQWAQQQTARAIARRLREQWLLLIASADENVRRVQQAIFAATFGDAPLAMDGALYEEKYLLGDIIKYPAAAIAVRNADLLAREVMLNRVHGSEAARGLKELARSLGVQVQILAERDDATVPQQLQRLRDWKSLFSNTGYAYRSLNRTLMNLPGRVPHRLVCGLRLLHLERPLTSRLELLCVAQYAAILGSRMETMHRGANHLHVFQHATADQIRECLRRVGTHLRQELDGRKAASVKQMVQFLADCPEPHTGNLVGLAEKSIRWHRDRQAEQVAQMRRHYGGDTLMARPAIELPSLEGVTFLDTVGAVCSEAEKMQHCVASYIDLAVLGSCYLFHVEHRGESATVEVGCEGRVRQSQGPRNQKNAASRWGKRALGQWATGLPKPAWSMDTGDDGIPF